MTEWIGPAQFHDADGVDDWRMLGSGIGAHFRTASFASGIEFATAVGQLTQTSHLDLRPTGVTVRLPMDWENGLSGSYIELARQISAAAWAAGATAEPAAVQDVQLTIDAFDIPAVRAFWQAVLGYRQLGEEDLVDPLSSGPPLWFQEMDTSRTQRNRIHVDVFVPHDQAEARVAAALAAGGTLLTDRHAPAWWTLADPEGNEVDVATWTGRG